MPLYAQERVKWGITSYKRWPCWLTEHGRLREENDDDDDNDDKPSQPSSQVYTTKPRDYRDYRGTVVEGYQGQWALRSGDPQFQAALLQQAGLYRNQHKTFLTTRGTRNGD